MPQLSMMVAVLLALAGLGVLIFFIHHAAASIQAPNVIAAVTHDLHEAIDDLYPERFGEGGDAIDQRDESSGSQLPDTFDADSAKVLAGVGGYIQRIEAEQLMSEARDRDLILRIDHRPGQYVQWDDAIITIWPRSRVDESIKEFVRQTFAISDQRSLSQDAEFAVEQLVEVSARALSPGINDPFTAMHCVDRLCEGLSRLATRRFPSRYRLDDAGRLRVIAYRKTFQDFVDIALNQIRQYASKSVDVLLRMLEGLERVARHVHSEDDRRCLREHAIMIRDSAIAACSADRDCKKVEARYAAFEASLQRPA